MPKSLIKFFIIFIKLLLHYFVSSHFFSVVSSVMLKAIKENLWTMRVNRGEDEAEGYTYVPPTTNKIMNLEFKCPIGCNAILDSYQKLCVHTTSLKCTIFPSQFYVCGMTLNDGTVCEASLARSGHFFEHFKKARKTHPAIMYESQTHRQYAACLRVLYKKLSNLHVAQFLPHIPLAATRMQSPGDISLCDIDFCLTQICGDGQLHKKHHLNQDKLTLTFECCSGYHVSAKCRNDCETVGRLQKVAWLHRLSGKLFFSRIRPEYSTCFASCLRRKTSDSLCCTQPGCPRSFHPACLAPSVVAVPFVCPDPQFCANPQ